MSDSKAERLLINILSWGQIVAPTAVWVYIIWSDRGSELSILTVYAFLILGLPMILGALAGSTGLLQRKRWGWWVSVIVALIAISLGIFFNLRAIGPFSILGMLFVIALFTLLVKRRIWFYEGSEHE